MPDSKLVVSFILQMNTFPQSNTARTITEATHDILMQSGNQVYLDLFMRHVALQSRVETLQ
jgi:hypothetical protein